jgi:phage baseplate assembly protein gpV
VAWTQTDLDRLDAALSGNVRSVTFADGRQVTYQDASQMIEVRKLIKAELLASASQVNPRIRATRGTMRRP